MHINLQSSFFFIQSMHASDWCGHKQEHIFIVDSSLNIKVGSYCLLIVQFDPVTMSLEDLSLTQASAKPALIQIKNHHNVLSTLQQIFRVHGLYTLCGIQRQVFGFLETISPARELHEWSKWPWFNVGNRKL